MGGRRQVVTSPEAAFPPQWRWGYQKDLGGEGICTQILFSGRGGKKVLVRVQTSMQGYLCKQIVVLLRKYEKMRL